MISRQFVRYLIVGVSNTALSYLIYCALLRLGLPFTVANLIALIAGILISFTSQSRWVFDNRDARRLLPYVLVWSIMYAINIGLIWLFMRFGLNAYLAGLVALPPTVLISYVLQRLFVFQKAP